MAADANYAPSVPIHWILGRIIHVPLPERKSTLPSLVDREEILNRSSLDRFSLIDVRGEGPVGGKL